MIGSDHLPLSSTSSSLLFFSAGLMQISGCSVWSFYLGLFVLLKWEIWALSQYTTYKRAATVQLFKGYSQVEGHFNKFLDLRNVFARERVFHEQGSEFAEKSVQGNSWGTTDVFFIFLFFELTMRIYIYILICFPWQISPSMQIHCNPRRSFLW